MPTVSTPRIATAAALATLLFTALFVTQGMGPVDFWWWMTGSICAVVALAALLDRGFYPAMAADTENRIGRKVLIGMLSAFALYAVFLVGNVVSRRIFPFAGADIDSVYDLKATASHTRIVLLMALVIGPGEELFWRGFLQRAVSTRTTPTGGWLFALFLYTAVHAGSGNSMLVIAALVAGAFWGWLYLRFNSIVINVVSHTAWDLLVFFVLPFSN